MLLAAGRDKLGATFALMFPLLVNCSAFDEPTCSGLEDEQETHQVVIRALNRTSVPLFFMTMGNAAGAEAYSLVHEDQRVPWLPTVCASCEQAMRDQPCTIVDGLEVPPAIAPGGRHEFVWTGTLQMLRRPPVGCAPSGFASGDGSCEQSVRAAAGKYVVEVTAFEQGWCRPEDGCTCAPSTSSCELQSLLPNDVYATQEATFSFPNDALVEVVFE